MYAKEKTHYGVKALSFVWAFCLLSLSGFAQDFGRANPYQGKMHEGYKDGYAILIPDDDEKDVEKAAKKKLKDYDADKVSNEKKGIMAEKLAMPGAGGAVNVYMETALIKDNVVRLEAYVFAAGTAIQNETVQSWLNEFGADVAREILDENLDDARDELDDVEDEVNDYQKEIEKAEEEIKDCEQTIEEQKALIKSTEKELEQGREKVKEQEKQVEQLEDTYRSIK